MVLRICHGFLVRQRRPVLCYREGLGASEVPFNCHHLAGPAAQGASARHPHSRTLVAVPAGSRPLIPSPGHGRHSRPRPRELLSGPRPWRQAPRRCPTAKGSAATSRRPPAPPPPPPGIRESPVAPGPPSSSRAREAPAAAAAGWPEEGPRPRLPPRPSAQAPRRASRPRFPLPRPGDRTHPRAQPRRRGRRRAAAPTARRAAPAAPRSPRSEPGRAAAAAVSASFAPSPTSRLRRPGGWGGRRRREGPSRPPAAGNPGASAGGGSGRPRLQQGLPRGDTWPRGSRASVAPREFDRRPGRAASSRPGPGAAGLGANGVQLRRNGGTSEVPSQAPRQGRAASRKEP